MDKQRKRQTKEKTNKGKDKQRKRQIEEEKRTERKQNNMEKQRGKNTAKLL